jgi:hypothetical protein
MNKITRVSFGAQPRATPGCHHGGHEDNAAKPCDACYMAELKVSDRFGLWAPSQATPTRRRHAV